MAVYRALHPEAGVDRLYVKTNIGRRGLITIEDCARIEISNLKAYIEGSNEQLIVAVKEDMLGGGEEKNETQAEKLDKYKKKSLHGKFYKSTEGQRWKMLEIAAEGKPKK